MDVRARDVLRNEVLEKMNRGEVVASMTVRISRGIEIAQLAKVAGFDSLYVDLEHSSLSIESTSQICMAAMSLGIAPYVRVPANTPEWISRVLDTGALGIIAPHVTSAAQAREVVAHAKFAPLGQRSVVSGLPHFQFRNVPPAEVCSVLNAATMVIAQLESAAGIEAADAILAVAGVDMVMVGANDLASDLGIPGEFDHPRLREAFTHAWEACSRHGKHLGIGGLAGRPDLVEDLVKMGARYVSCGTDAGFLLTAASAKAKEVRNLTVRP